MEGMTEASLRLSFKFMVYFSEQFLFFYVVFNPSFILFVKTNRGRSELWVVMFLYLHLFCYAHLIGHCSNWFFDVIKSDTYFNRLFLRNNRLFF